MSQHILQVNSGFIMSKDNWSVSVKWIEKFVFLRKKNISMPKLNGDMYMSYYKKYITNYTNIDMKKSCW